MFTLIFLFFNLGAMNDCYKYYSVAELTALLEKDDISIYSFEHQLKYSSAFVYFTKDDQVILLPNELNPELKGILFKSKTCYYDFLMTNDLQVDDQHLNLYERNQNIILNISRDSGIYISYLRECCFTKQEIPEDSIAFYYQEMMSDTTLSDKELVILGIVVGNYYINKNDGHWILIQELGEFKPYYLPAILTSSNHIIKLHDKLISNKQGGLYDFNFFINSNAITTPKLKFEMLKMTKKRFMIVH